MRWEVADAEVAWQLIFVVGMTETDLLLPPNLLKLTSILLRYAKCASLGLSYLSTCLSPMDFNGI